MEVNNQITKKEKKPKFGDWLQGDGVKTSLMNALGSEKAMTKFTANTVSLVSTNPTLAECDFSSIVGSCLLANALDLPLSTSLGFAYIIPFKDNKNDRTVATFVLGYKGYIQLAIRSGYYKKINAIAIKEGELKYFNQMTEEFEIKLIEDDEARENAPTIGYFAMFEHLNGFRKCLYWSKEKMISHADRYSKAFSRGETKIKTKFGEVTKASYADYLAGKIAPKTDYLYSSFWYKDFDSMALKTLIRQIISKWGIMSVEMQKAYETDTDEMNKTEGVDLSESFAENQKQIEENFFETETESADEENFEELPKEEPKKRGRKPKTDETADEQSEFFQE